MLIMLTKADNYKREERAPPQDTPFFFKMERNDPRGEFFNFFFQKLFLGVHSGLIRLLGAGGGGGGDTETLHKIEAGRIFGG